MNRIVAAIAMSPAAFWPARSRMTARSSAPIGRSVMAGWTGCPNQVPFRKSFKGRIGRKRAFSQRWLKSPNGRAQPSCDATSRASRRATSPPPRGVYPQTVHSHHKFGDKYGQKSCNFVDKPVVGHEPRAVHFVLPEGAG